jgi:hypothetical protein
METQVVIASPHVATAAKSLMFLNNKETLLKEKSTKIKESTSCYRLSLCY